MKAQEEVHPALVTAPVAQYVARSGKSISTLVKYTEFNKQGKEHAALKAMSSDQVAGLICPDQVFLDIARFRVLVWMTHAEFAVSRR